MNIIGILLESDLRKSYDHIHKNLLKCINFQGGKKNLIENLAKATFLVFAPSGFRSSRSNKLCPLLACLP